MDAPHYLPALKKHVYLCKDCKDDFYKRFRGWLAKQKEQQQ